LASNGGELSPFEPPSNKVSLSFSPDFFVAGDFNADGLSDILATSRGAASLILLSGNGKGDFAEPRTIKLNGQVTAFTVGEIGRKDGQTDVAVAIQNPKGAQLLVFEHPEGAFKHKPEVFALPATATDLSIGNLDEDSYGDVAIAGGNNLTIVHGRGQAYPLDLKVELNIKRPAAFMQTRQFAFDISALAIGRFTASRGDSLALLATDGSIYTLEPGAPATKSTSNKLTAEALQRTKKLSFAPVQAGSALRKFAAVKVELPRNEQEADQSGQLMIDSRLSQKDRETFTREKVERSAADFAKLSHSEQNKITTEAVQRTEESNQKRKETFERTLSSHPIPLANFKVEALMSDAHLVNAAHSSSAHKMLTARFSDSAKDDLVLVDSIGKQIQIIAQMNNEVQSPRTELVSLDTDAAPLAILPMRLNSDALSDLVVLRANSAVPTVSITAPASTFVVNTTDDNSGGACDGTDPCALRRAIIIANSNPGLDTITFNIPGAGVHTIHPVSALPDVTGAVVIDGTTQPGFAGKPLIEIEGDLLSGAAEGLKIRASSSVIRGLAINHIPSVFDEDTGSQIGGSGITVLSTSDSPNVTNVIVEGNFLGTDPTGEFKKGNDANGAHIFDADNNTVGGRTPQARNILSGNGKYSEQKTGVGLAITGGNNNRIEGNYIGADASGVVKLGNSYGVFFTGKNNQFGGDAAGAGNVVSGNGGPLNQFNKCFGGGIDVVALIATADGSLLTDSNNFKGNLIGTTANGEARLGNCTTGITSNVDVNTTIGSITEPGRNVIADNGWDAIWCAYTALPYSPQSGGSTIVGNNIGTDKAGNFAMANDERNNSCVGFCLVTNTVWVSAGDLDFVVVGSPGGTTPGGACTGGCNLISGNYNPNTFGGGGLYRTGYGIVLAVNNYFGTNRAGTAALPNNYGALSYYGSIIFGAEFSDGNGGLIEGGNLASGNNGAGFILDAIDIGGIFEVNGNLVGLSSDGNNPIPNGALNAGGAGMSITTRPGTEANVGGTDLLQKNTIAATTDDGFAGGAGISLATYGTTRVINNWIGLSKFGAPLPNSGSGISATGTGRAFIGGVGGNEGNVIFGNGRAGVAVSQFTGNFGTSFTKSVTIRGNYITNNGGLGIDLFNATQGALEPDGVTPNDCQDFDTGANGLQNFPELFAPVPTANGGISVDAVLRSSPSQPYTIDFYTNNTPDPTNYGEGANYIGSSNVKTDGNGFVGFTFVSPNPVDPAKKITATATDSKGNTSEFSCFAGGCTSGTLSQALAQAVETPELTSCIQPIIVTVDTDEDDANTADGVCDVDLNKPGLQCTLRAAIQEANARTGFDVIHFAIPGNGVQVIFPTSELPPITQPVFIDGTTQPGYTDYPLISLFGAGVTATTAVGLNFANGSGGSSTLPGSSLVGLAVNGWADTGVKFDNSNDFRVRSCYIGASVFASPPRQKNGILVKSSDDGQIGVSNFSAGGNVVSSNDIGIHIVGGGRVEITGNRIGTSANGSDAAPNNIGIVLEQKLLSGSNNHSIVGNLITSNTLCGIFVSGGIFFFSNPAANRITDNLIGTNAEGNFSVFADFNHATGIFIKDSSGNLIDNNTIVHQNDAGIHIATKDSDHADKNLVVGNRIGVLADGLTAAGNRIGVWIEDASKNEIKPGRTVNIISGNSESGISITGGLDLNFPSRVSDANKIEFNFIGATSGQTVGNGTHGIHLNGNVGKTKINFNAVFGNTQNGIWLKGNAQLNELEGNNVCGNKSTGILLSLGAGNNIIHNNAIGRPAVNNDPALPNKVGLQITGASSNKVYGNNFRVNTDIGIVLGNVIPQVDETVPLTSALALTPGPLLATDSDVTKNEIYDNDVTNGKIGIAVTEGAKNNFIGQSSDKGTGNRISGHTSGVGYGIFLGTTSTNPGADLLPTKNQIIGNAVGGSFADRIGDAPNPNRVGIVVSKARDNIIGGENSFFRNFVGNNLEDGIRLTGAQTSGNLIRFNDIGLTGANIANPYAPEGNSGDGILLDGTGRNDIKDNLIGYNHGDGIRISNITGLGQSEYSLIISGNSIGATDKSANQAGNQGFGIYLAGVQHALIGFEPNSGERPNTISANGRGGIFIGSGSTGIEINHSFVGIVSLNNNAFDMGNHGHGISIFGGRAHLIGGADAGNVISSNFGDGIYIDSAIGTSIYGNLIGVGQANGHDMPFPNRADGIRLVNAEDTQIGFVQRNIIGKNFGSGIVVGGSRLTTIKNNFIGTNENGYNLGNTGHGVLFTDGATLNSVGGREIKAGNTIAFNAAGVLVDPSALCCNFVDPNIIFGNAGLGIDLGGSGVPLPNDPGDGDAGPNNLQNYPEFTSALLVPGDKLVITYKVDSAPGNSNYGADGLYVEIFKADASPNLQGQTFIGSTNYTITNYTGGLPGTAVLIINNASSFGIQAGNKLVATATDADGNTSEFTSTNVGVVAGTPTAADGNVGGTIADSNGVAISGATISLSGTETRETITDSKGNYRFDNVETNGFYTITPSRANYTFSPPNRSFSLLGVHTEASFTASANGDQANAIDTTEFFVRQQYLDFLGREPDPPGFKGWVKTIENCVPGEPSCDRVHVSEAFFKSEEFQQRGYFIYRFYSASLGRKPDYAEFGPDLARVSGFLESNQLEAAKVAFVSDFISRSAFVTKYNSLSNQQFVDTVVSTAGVTLSNKQTLIDGLNAGTLTRTAVLRQIAESAEVYQRFYNQAFVVMQYFGYLRRDPDILYLNWIAALDSGAVSRTMVTGFVNSTEYRRRFGP